MGQATPRLPHFLFLERAIFKARILMSGAACSVFVFVAAGQAAKSVEPSTRIQSMTSEKAMELAKQGRCKEALEALKRALTSNTDAETKKQAGLLGLRCAMT